MYQLTVGDIKMTAPTALRSAKQLNGEDDGGLRGVPRLNSKKIKTRVHTGSSNMSLLAQGFDSLQIFWIDWWVNIVTFFCEFFFSTTGNRTVKYTEWNCKVLSKIILTEMPPETFKACANIVGRCCANMLRSFARTFYVYKLVS